MTRHSTASATSCLHLAKRSGKKCLATYSRDAVVVGKPLPPATGIPAISLAKMSLLHWPRIPASQWVGTRSLAVSSPVASRFLFDWNPANSERQLRDDTATYSVCQRPLQVGFIVGDMAVNLGKHTSVRMPHDGGNGQVVMPLNELASPEPVTHCISKHLLPGNIGNVVEPIADREFRPWLSSVIQEKFARAVFGHKSVDDFKRNAMQVDYAFSSFPFRLLRRENNTLVFEIDVTRLDMPCFLRAASGLPEKYEKVPERLMGLKQGKNLLEVLQLHIRFAALRWRLFHAGKWRAFQMPLFHAPVVDTLHGDDSAPAVGTSPGGFAVNPFRDVPRLDSGGVQIGNAGMLEEVLEITAVPFARTRRTMFAAPSGVLRNQRVYRKCVFHRVECMIFLDLHQIRLFHVSGHYYKSGNENIHKQRAFETPKEKNQGQGCSLAMGEGAWNNSAISKRHIAGEARYNRGPCQEAGRGYSAFGGMGRNSATSAQT